MSTQIQRRRGTTAEHASFTGALAETTVDTDKDTVVVHDGTTVGGHPLMRENGSNSALALGSAGTPSLKFTGDTNTGIYSPGADQVAISTGGSQRLSISSTGVATFSANIATNGSGFDINPASGLPNISLRSGNTYRGYIEGNASGGITIGSGPAALTAMTIDSSQRVGIGTSLPQELFNVSTASVSDATLIRLDGGAGIRQRFFPSSGTGKFNWQIAAQSNVDNGFEITPSSTSGGSTFSTPAVVVKSDGKTGIGSTTLIERLHVNGGVRLDVDNQGLYFNSSTTSINGNGTSSYITFNTSNVEKARLDSSGRWLLGTSSTSGVRKLVVKARTDNSSGNGGIILQRGSTPTGADQGIGIVAFEGSDTGSGAYVYAQSEGAWTAGTSQPTRLEFHTCASGSNNPTERMRINNAGDMSFNGTNVTTTNGGIGQVYKFFGGANNPIMAFETTGLERNACLEYRRTGRSGNARASQISIGENASNQGRVEVYSSVANADVSGGVRLENGATSWSSISDIRLKNVISNFDNALADVSNLQAFRFTWKNDATEAPQVGLSAQSVQAVLPEAVASGKLINAPEDDDAEYLSVRYTEVIPLLVAALQESKERIEALEAEVAALKAQ